MVMRLTSSNAILQNKNISKHRISEGGFGHSFPVFIASWGRVPRMMKAGMEAPSDLCYEHVTYISEHSNVMVFTSKRTSCFTWCIHF
jgi:hypothetical protein